MSVKKTIYKKPRLGHSYANVMYKKLMQHSNCMIEIGAFYYNTSEVNDISAIEIANYHNGENIAIECVRCNDALIDFDRPLRGGE